MVRVVYIFCREEVAIFVANCYFYSHPKEHLMAASSVLKTWNAFDNSTSFSIRLRLLPVKQIADLGPASSLALSPPP